MVAPEEISQQQSDNTGGAFGKFKQTLSSSLLTAQDKGKISRVEHSKIKWLKNISRIINLNLNNEREKFLNFLKKFCVLNPCDNRRKKFKTCSNKRILLLPYNC